MISVTQWDCADVCDWLIGHGHQDYADLFARQKIDGRALLSITETDLSGPYLSIKYLGDIKRLHYDIEQLKRASTDSLSCPVNGLYKCPCISIHERPSLTGQTGALRDRSPSEGSLESEWGPQNLPTNLGESGFATNLEPNYFKTILSALYMLSVALLTSIVMVIVHDRVPDMKKYPPLPDLFLDNLPLIPWAFHMCELSGFALSTMWIIVLLWHRHRFILIRRFCALSGSIFLLRCVTMLITSLSVPGSHLDCSPRPYGDIWAKLSQAYHIWSGMGLSTNGVRTCGDYMFSGHTVVLTLLNFFITEYTSRRYFYVHTIAWVLNAFGIFFILAAHEHYSIDVFIAFYITSRLFLYYHTLANNRTLKQRDYRRTRIWFPLFSFFESNIDGIVPNEYMFLVQRRHVAAVVKFLKDLYLDMTLFMHERYNEMAVQYDMRKKKKK